jgi:hypothetical protein
VRARSARSTAGYFETLGIPVLRGRGFGAQDRLGAQRVAVVNEALARRLGGDGLGARITVGLPSDDATLTVIGVVGDSTNNGLREAARPMLLPAGGPDPALPGQPRGAHRQRPRAGGGRGPAGGARRGQASPVVGVRTMRVQVERALGGERALASLASTFGLAALLLVCVGLYGVIAQWAAQRTREIGVRMALGATASGVRWMVMRQAFTLVLVGLAVGLPASVAVARLLRGLLFGLGALDPRRWWRRRAHVRGGHARRLPARPAGLARGSHGGVAIGVISQARCGGPRAG